MSIPASEMQFSKFTTRSPSSPASSILSSFKYGTSKDWCPYRQVNLLLLKKDKNRIITNSSLLGCYSVLTSEWNWHFGWQQCLHLQSQAIWENCHSSSLPDPEDISNISNMLIWNVSNLSSMLVSRMLKQMSHLGHLLAKEMQSCLRHHEMKKS